MVMATMGMMAHQTESRILTGRCRHARTMVISTATAFPAVAFFFASPPRFTVIARYRINHGHDEFKKYSIGYEHLDTQQLPTDPYKNGTT
jgi:hypothetical protein